MNLSYKRGYLLTLIAIVFISATLLLISRHQNQKFTITSEAIAPSPPENDEHEQLQVELKDRMHQEFLMTQDPALKAIPTERLQEAEKWIANQAAFLQNNPSQILSAISWQERGPNNIGGRVRALIFDLNDATNNTVFAGSVSGGLWKTTNFKNASPTWTQISSVSANLAITTLAQDPRIGFKNIMYAGTGEGYFNADAVNGLGIYKSTDGGATWSLIPSTTTGGTNVNDFNLIQKIVVHPSNGDVYAATISNVNCNRGGILRSQNGGTNWTNLLGKFWTTGATCSDYHNFLGYDLDISASGDIYATLQDFGGGGNPTGKIFRSPAGASVGNIGTWDSIPPGPRTGSFYQRIELACAPSNNDRVYAVCQGAGTGIDTIVSYSVASNTWTNADVSSNWCDQGSATSLDFTRGQAWYDLTIAVQPDNDAVVLVGGVDLMKSTNSGSTWSQLTQWNVGCASLPQIHADNHNIIYLPGSASEYVVTNDGGIYYTADNGVTFSNRNSGLDITQYYSVAMHPTSGSDYLIGGAQDNGSHKFVNPGINSVTTVTGGDGGFSFIDQDDPTTQITSFTGSNYTISRNSGTSFTVSASFSGADRFINPTDYDNTQNILYCGGPLGKLRRIINIASGVPSSTDFTIGGFGSYSVSAVKVDPNTANRVFFAFAQGGNNSNLAPKLIYADNANAVPAATQITLPGSMGINQYISSIDIENGNASHLLLTLSNYGITSVYESVDLGVTWTALDNGSNLPDMPVRWGAFIPGGFNPGLSAQSVGGAILATEKGVFTTSNINGASTVWSANNNTMGNVRTDMVMLRVADRTVAVATHGRGMFSGQLFLGALPVTFKSFNGIAEQKQNKLFWKVENEFKNKGYELERKYENGTNFNMIGFVAANSNNTSNSYSFDDKLVDLGKENAFYRLKQIDIDGKFTYSAVVQLGRKASRNFVEYIAADKHTLIIRINNSNPTQSIKIQLLDMSGKLLRNLQTGYETQQLDISNLPGGIYMLRVSNSKGDSYTGRFVK